MLYPLDLPTSTHAQEQFLVTAWTFSNQESSLLFVVLSMVAKQGNPEWHQGVQLSVFSFRFNLTVDKNKLGEKKHETFRKQLFKSNLLTSGCWTLPFFKSSKSAKVTSTCPAWVTSTCPRPAASVKGAASHSGLKWQLWSSCSTRSWSTFIKNMYGINFKIYLYRE